MTPTCTSALPSVEGCLARLLASTSVEELEAVYAEVVDLLGEQIVLYRAYESSSGRLATATAPELVGDVRRTRHRLTSVNRTSYQGHRYDVVPARFSVCDHTCLETAFARRKAELCATAADHILQVDDLDQLTEAYTAVVQTVGSNPAIDCAYRVRTQQLAAHAGDAGPSCCGIAAA